MYITNIIPTLMSLVALMFSGYSLYESALRAPQLSIFVAPRIDYTDPDRPEAVREVFILPLTIANDGAQPRSRQPAHQREKDVLCRPAGHVGRAAVASVRAGRAGGPGDILERGAV